MSDTRKTCRVCGCTDDDCSACIEKTGAPCSWVELDLCSACVGVEGRRGAIMVGRLGKEGSIDLWQDLRPLLEKIEQRIDRFDRWIESIDEEAAKGCLDHEVVDLDRRLDQIEERIERVAVFLVKHLRRDHGGAFDQEHDDWLMELER